MTRRDFLSLVAAGAGAACSPAGAFLDGRDAIARGRGFLLSRQSRDGAWRSRTYGLLSGGDSLTGLALHALLSAGDSSSAVESGLTCLRSRMSVDGALGFSDPSVPDYPNYSTGFALRTLVKVKPKGWRADADRMIAWLRNRQFAEHDGWTPDRSAYGGWGMGGARLAPPNAGHVDLSMTRHVAEALAEAGAPPGDPSLARARTFLERCRNPHDGGFSFSPVVDEANKAGAENGRYRSYGTAVADGLRTVVALGGPDTQAAAARAWLARHHRSTEVPGFDRHPDWRWRQGLYYYYAASAAPHLPPEHRQALHAELASRQLPDGSWSNPESLVKEDDPLIATPLALLALSS